jgi:hypothetical protein
LRSIFGNGAQVVSVKVKQVEGVAFQPALLAAGQVCLELGEVCRAVFDHDHFGIDDGLA